MLVGCFAIADFDAYDTSRGPSDAGASAEAASEVITIDPIAPLTLTRGAALAVAISLDRHGAHGEVHVSASPIPIGVSLSESTLAPGVSAGSLALSIATSAAPGTYILPVVATLDGARSAAADLRVTVLPSRPDPSFANNGTFLGSPDGVLEDLVVDDRGRVLLGIRVEPDFIVYRDNGDGAFARVFDLSAAKTTHRLATFPGGDILVASAFTAERHEADGGALVWTAPLFVPAFPLDTEVRLAIGSDSKVTALRATDLLVSGVELRRLVPDGGAETPFGDAGSVELDRVLDLTQAASSLALVESDIALCGVQQRASQGQSSNLLAIGRTATGAEDPTWDGGLDLPGNDTASFFACVGLATQGDMLVAATTTVHVSVNDEDEQPELVLVGMRRGALVSSFGAAGIAHHFEVGRARAMGLAVSTARTYTAYNAELGAKVSARVLGTLPNGAADPSFGNVATPGVLVLPSDDVAVSTKTVAIRTQADGRLLVGALLVDPPGWFVTRFLP